MRILVLYILLSLSWLVLTSPRKPKGRPRPRPRPRPKPGPTASLSCCLQKTVGGVSYTLVQEADTSGYGCLANCAYQQNGNPGQLFCFVAGGLDVDCGVEEATSQNMTIAITADNGFLLSYVSSVGTITPLPPVNVDWYTTFYLEVPSTARLLIVAATNIALQAGIILSSSTPGLVTDGSWRCQGQGYTNYLSDTWPGLADTAAYIESSVTSGNWESWPYAVVQGANGCCVWGNRPGISSDAKWIWTEPAVYDDTKNVAYKAICIKRL